MKTNKEIIEEFKCKEHKDQKCGGCNNCNLYWKVKKALANQKDEILGEIEEGLPKEREGEGQDIITVTDIKLESFKEGYNKYRSEVKALLKKI